MYPEKIEYEGITYSCAEAAFQASKTNDRKEKLRISKMNGYDARKAGRQVALRPDWDVVRTRTMYDILSIKFSNPEMASKLKSTEGYDLIEENTWNDKFWGVDSRTGAGSNNLGKMLMSIRGHIGGKL